MIKRIGIFCATTFLAAILSVLLLPLMTNAQTRDLGAIKGQVRDAQGGAIADAAVKLTNKGSGLERTAKTDLHGGFNFDGLPLTGLYTLTVTAANFSPIERPDIQLQASHTATVDITMDVAAAKAYVTVNGTPGTLETDSSQITSRLDLQKIENTPILNNKLTSLVLLDSNVRPSNTTGDLFTNETLFVVNGGGRRQTTLSIDNTTADDSWGRQTLLTALPFTSVQEFTIIPNSSSAEYGRTSGSAVNIVTKSGTNNFHGDFSGTGRPAFSESGAPLTALGLKAQNTFEQGSGSITGPIIKDRTHFMVSAEYNHQVRDAVITSPLERGAFFSGNFGQTLFIARVDHQLTSRNLLTFRANFDRLSDSNPQDGVSGNNLPSTQRIFSKRGYAAALTNTTTFTPHLINEARFQWQLASPVTQFEPASPGPQLSQAGVFTAGDSRFADLQNHQYEQADTLSWIHGSHEIKTGVDLVESSSGGFGQEFGTGFLDGQFTINPAACVILAAGSPVPNTSACNGPSPTVIPIANLTVANVTQFTQTFGNQSYNIKETLWGVFVQDNWSVLPSLTLNLGLRYEGQTFLGDDNNFAPRAGLAWRVPHTYTAVIRASYGIYYSEVRTDEGAGYLLGGPTGLFTFSAGPGQCGFPSSITPWASLAAMLASPGCTGPSGSATIPERTITIPLGAAASLNSDFNVAGLKFYPQSLLNPYTQQWTFGIEHEIAKGWVVSADYIGSHSVKLERPADLNPPTPCTYTTVLAQRNLTGGNCVLIAAGPASPNAGNAADIRSLAVANATRPVQPTGTCTNQSASFIPAIGNCFNNYSSIMAIVNFGSGTYNGVQFKLNKQFSHHFSMLLSYTYSHAIDTVEPDAANQAPNDFNSLGAAEKATSILDQRHRAALSGWYDFPLGFRWGVFTTLGSGFPYNVTTGVDNNGDGSTSDRPFMNGAVVPRNFGRGTPIYDVATSLQKTFSLGEHAKITMRAEAFNLFNHSNFFGRSGVFGNLPAASTTFGTPVGGIANVGPAREMQFAARVQF
jgi:outer membrane receptor protein involved in Fe transport